MSDKKPVKDAPAKAGATRQSFAEWFMEENEPFYAMIATREPLVLDEVEQKFLDGSVSSGLRGLDAGRTPQTQGALMLCAAFLSRGKAPPPEMSMWLSTRLQAIAKGDSPWGKPLVSRKAGQKNADDWQDQYVVAAYYDHLRKKGEKHEVAWRQTKGLAAILTDDVMTEDKIKNYWRKYFGSGK